MGITKINSNETFVQARQSSRIHWSGIEHRLEFVAEWNGMDFFNDSKATDIESVYYSFETLNNPIIWLFGNTDTEAYDYTALEKMIRYKVVSAYGFGKNLDWHPEFAEWVDKFGNYATLEEAFNAAIAEPKQDTVVLLSPGNGSFDLFNNFKERGERFKDLVADLS